MTVIASIHLADVGAGSAIRMRGGPRGAEGLRHADVGIAAPLRGSRRPSPMFGRLGLVAFWDGDEALDRFLADHPFAQRLSGGWQARLEPLRAFGTWTGLPDDMARSRTTTYDGPSVVLTLGRLRLGQAIRFVRTSGGAERAALEAPGLLWATALAKPPLVATCSLWESTDALSRYAYGAAGDPHPHAIATDRKKPFHHRSAFIRFRPYRVEGSLAGRNPLPARALEG